MAGAHEHYARWLLPTDDERVRRHRDEVLAFATSPWRPAPRPEATEIVVAEARPAAAPERWHAGVEPDPDNVRRLLAETAAAGDAPPARTASALRSTVGQSAPPKSRRELLTIFEELSQMSDRLGDGWRSSG